MNEEVKVEETTVEDVEQFEDGLHEDGKGDVESE